MKLPDKMPQLVNLLEFHDLNIGLSVIQFQDKVKYLVTLSTGEILDALAEGNNTGALVRLLLFQLDVAVEASGGDLSTIIFIIPELFEIDEFSLNTDLIEAAEKTQLGPILYWNPKSDFSYNAIWEEFKVKNNLNSSERKSDFGLNFYLDGKNLRLYIQQLIYQSGLRQLKSILQRDIEEKPILKSTSTEQEDEFKGFYTRKDLRKILELGDSTIRKYELDGTLKPIEFSGRTKRYDKRDVDGLAETLKNQKFKRKSKY